MALNNLERYASQVDRTILFRTLAEHPGAATLLARVGGSSQFLADVLHRWPRHLAWLLEGRTMRAWRPDEMAADLDRALAPFPVRDARMNVLRRFKYRQLLRIASRDLLGDADLVETTLELSNLADACVEQAWRTADGELRARYGAPRAADGRETGLAIVAMGKLGGQELNYSSDIDLMFVYGDDGTTHGGSDGRLANDEYFTRLCRDIVAFLESVTDEGYAFRVDLRLRPEGRMGAMVLSLDGYRTYHAERAELWERQALLKARVAGGDPTVGARFMAFAESVVYRPGLDQRILPAIRRMKGEIDRALEQRGSERDNVKLGHGGIREIEFVTQALQLLYGGDDAGLRERNTCAALARLAERGYIAPGLGRELVDAYTHLRTVEHRLQIVHEFQTHTLPSDVVELGRLARRMGIAARPRGAARVFRTRHRRVTTLVRRAFREFFAERPRESRTTRVKLPGLLALSATGFSDPVRARQNLRLILEERPLVPYVRARRTALARLLPALLDALWKSPDPDEALNQFERFVAAAGPRAGLIELLAADAEALTGLVALCAGGDLLSELLIVHPELLTSLAGHVAAPAPRTARAFRAALAPVFAPYVSGGERRDRLRRLKQALELGVVWRYLLGASGIDGYSREMTALAEATLTAGWLLVLTELAERHGAPRAADGRFIGAVIGGLGKLGGRELTTGSDLDIFVLYEDDGTTDGVEPIEAHTFYDRAADELAHALGDPTAAGVAFAVDLRLRAGSKGSGFATSIGAAERYYAEHGDLWERQTLTRARVVLGDRRLARRVRALLGRLVYGPTLTPDQRGEIADVRRRMELELAGETPERYHVKWGRGGLVDVEFLAQTLTLLYGAKHPSVRRASTRAALAALGREGLLDGSTAAALTAHYRVLRRVSAALRLLSARPRDSFEVGGPMAARVANALGYASPDAFVADYRARTAAVRAAWDAVMSAAVSR